MLRCVVNGIRDERMLNVLSMLDSCGIVYDILTNENEFVEVQGKKFDFKDVKDKIGEIQKRYYEGA